MSRAGKGRFSEPMAEPDRAAEPVATAALDVGSSRYVSRVSEGQARATPAEYETPAEPTSGTTGWDLVTRFRQVHHTLQLSLDHALENEGLSFA